LVWEERGFIKGDGVELVVDNMVSTTSTKKGRCIGMGGVYYRRWVELVVDNMVSITNTKRGRFIGMVGVLFQEMG
jgi:hypothetical protein